MTGSMPGHRELDDGFEVSLGQFALAANLVGLLPRPQTLEGGADREHVAVSIALADDLHADRKSLGEPRRDGGCRIAAEIDGKSQAPADQPVDLLAGDRLRTQSVAVVGILD